LDEVKAESSVTILRTATGINLPRQLNAQRPKINDEVRRNSYNKWRTAVQRAFTLP